MDFDKLKQWMELAKKYQSGDFWNGMFDQSSFNQFMKENIDVDPPHSNTQNESTGKYPIIDIYITESEIIVLAELAGYSKENLQVSVSGNKLLLKGMLAPIVSGHPVLQERRYGQFQRLIELPEPANSRDIRAKFQNGLLVLAYDRQYFEEQRVSIE